jgi:hypothetical protein
MKSESDRPLINHYTDPDLFSFRVDGRRLRVREAPKRKQEVQESDK